MGKTDALKRKGKVVQKKSFPWPLCALLLLVFIGLYFYIIALSSYSKTHQPPPHQPFIINSTFSSPLHSLSPPKDKDDESVCDYTNGKWVFDKLGPLYNDERCGTVKEGRNCKSHGRPDVEYLNWRWAPEKCNLPRFDPRTFLQILKNKHLAFVGDSLARNQLESLLCMLATVSPPELVYLQGEDSQFRKWHFPAQHLNVSIYWSPFLVKGVEKNNEKNYNVLYLESVDESWGSDIGEIDLLVLSVGHWFLLPAVFYYEGKVLGCHYCEGQNYTEIGFYGAFEMAHKTAFKTILERKGPSGGSIDVIVTTFPPAHYEGEWDKFGACSKTLPYKPEEKVLEGIEYEMRNVGIVETKEAKAKSKAKEFGNRIRFEALDITKLSLLRPDAHPGPYMNPNPFHDGIKDRVQNDCVHWCLPGAIDTWNEILLEVVKRWSGESKKEM
nr:Protein ALTERED XYLOGLUCAN 4 [Ipomoea batatas]